MRILEELQSPYNGHIKVEKTFGYGNTIRAANLTQSGGILFSIWRTTLRKVWKNNKDTSINNALILGLGGGSLVTVIHTFWPEAKLTGVDIDPLMVEMGKKYLKLNPDEVKIVISDATAFCKKQIKAKHKYDLICIDMYNGDEFPPQFEELEFIEQVKSLLAENGVTVFNRLYYGEKRKLSVKFSKKLSEVFSTNDAIYPEANVMFVCKK